MGEPIATAPRNGLSIIVGDDDVGEFVMHWNPAATNALFAPGKTGMWEAADRSMTWSDHDGCGPSYWRHLAASPGSVGETGLRIPHNPLTPQVKP